MDEAVRQGVAFKGDTLEELAKDVGFSDAFVREVGEYNCAVKSGEDPFGKPKEFLKFTVEKGPFYALRAKVVNLSTLGGVRVDENMQALDKNLKKIGGP